MPTRLSMRSSISSRFRQNNEDRFNNDGIMKELIRDENNRSRNLSDWELQDLITPPPSFSSPWDLQRQSGQPHWAVWMHPFPGRLCDDCSPRTFAPPCRTRTNPLFAEEKKIDTEALSPSSTASRSMAGRSRARTRTAFSSRTGRSWPTATAATCSMWATRSRSRISTSSPK